MGKGSPGHTRRASAVRSSNFVSGLRTFFGACILALVVSAAIAASGLAGTGQTKLRMHPAAHRRAVPPAVATGAFGLDLMRAQPQGNVVLSPDGVAAALAMTGTGGAGRTAAEIARTLHLKGPAAFPAVGDLQRAIAAGQATAAVGDPEPPTLEIASGLFLQQGLSFGPAFLSGVQQHFGAAPETLDFAGNPTAALEAINGWVSAHTKGLVPRILDLLPEEMALALANAIYLDADWQRPFKQSETRSGVFHKAAGKTRVDFMHQTTQLRYGAGPGYSAVALPYRSSTLSLLVVLPVKQQLGSLQHRLDGRSLAGIAHGLSARSVILSLPRFHLNTDAELTGALEKLGMPTAFSDAADFSRITAAVPLKIGFIKHAADFTVDEEGTVAAAATVVGVVETSGPAVPRNAVTFNANRPFLFFLRDDRTGAILFAGRLTNPASAGA
jgi:serine protease inhibitor